MLKRKLCQAVIAWELTCEGPLLIKDGRFEDLKTQDSSKYTKKNGYPDTLFISRLSDVDFRAMAASCNNNPPQGDQFYVPGTSIRGPFRAQAERIIRTLNYNLQQPKFTACDPFQQESREDRPLSCSKRLEKEKDAPRKYADACLACKLFGYAGLASRVQFTDADIKPWEGCVNYNSLYRDMVGIDRFTGGAAADALMRFHVLENTRFTTTITVTNFELWQLGLLAYVFRDFEDPLTPSGSDNPQGPGLVPIGFGKTKGFGLVRGKVKQITLAYPHHLAATDRLHHLGSLMADSPDFDHYGFHPYEAPSFVFPPPEDDPLSLYHCFKLTTEQIQALWAAAAPAFNIYIEWLGASPEPASEDVL